MPIIRGMAVGSGEGLPPRDDLKGSTLRSIFGIELSSAAQFVIAGVVIFILLALFALVLRRLAGGRLRVKGQGAARARQPRLGVIDIYDLDQQRQLVLLRRDNVEHLIMIGGPNDVVVEASIVRGTRAGSAQPSAGNGEDRPLAPVYGEPDAAQPAPVIPPNPMAAAPAQPPLAQPPLAQPPLAQPPLPPQPSLPQVAVGAILAPAIIPDIGTPPAPRGARQPRADIDAADSQAQPAPPVPRQIPAEPAAMDVNLTRQIEEALQRSIVTPDFGLASGLVEPEGEGLSRTDRKDEPAPPVIPQAPATPQAPVMPRAVERREPAMTSPPAQRQAAAPQPPAPRSLATPVAPAILPARAPALPRGEPVMSSGNPSEPAMPVAVSPTLASPSLPRIDLSLRPASAPVQEAAAPAPASRPMPVEAKPAPQMRVTVEPAVPRPVSARPESAMPEPATPPAARTEVAPAEPVRNDPPVPASTPAAAATAAPDKQADTGSDPFSVEAIEAEFARLLGRTVPPKDGPKN
jgi:hypothetical protein